MMRRRAQVRPRLPDRQPAALEQRVPQACELVRSGRIGKVQTVLRRCRRAEPAVRPARGAEEPGLDWDRWLGPAPKRPYNSVLSPRGVHNHFPDWRNYREYSGGMMTDWGAHHFDIAQWGLGMDESGPVEIIPPEDPKADKRRALRLRQRRRGDPRRRSNRAGDVLAFIGTDGEIFVNRG